MWFWASPEPAGSCWDSSESVVFTNSPNHEKVIKMDPKSTYTIYKYSWGDRNSEMTLFRCPRTISGEFFFFFPRTLCPSAQDPSEACRKKRVLHVFWKWPDWQLTQISLNGSEKSRTVCPKTKFQKLRVAWDCVFMRALKKTKPF